MLYGGAKDLRGALFAQRDDVLRNLRRARAERCQAAFSTPGIRYEKQPANSPQLLEKLF